MQSKVTNSIFTSRIKSEENPEGSFSLSGYLPKCGYWGIWKRSDCWCHWLNECNQPSSIVDEVLPSLNETSAMNMVTKKKQLSKIFKYFPLQHFLT